MMYEVNLPDLGDDTVTEVVVSCWLVDEGDVVTQGDDLVEVTTDKAAFNVPSPKSGTLVEILVSEGDTAGRDDVLCILEL